jgi:uncharacterized membrane protein
MSLEILFIFAVGSLAGWVMEFFFRAFVEKKAIIPGFLNGPYLPIHGFGLLILFFIATWPLNLIWQSVWFMIIATGMELATGIFFLKYYRVKLWDYSDRWLNYQGIICPLYSFFWFFLALMFYYFVAPVWGNLSAVFFSQKVFILGLGIFYGFFIVDLAMSFNLVKKLKYYATEFNLKYKSKLTVNFETVKDDILAYLKKPRWTFFGGQYYLSLRNFVKQNLRKQLNDYLAKRKRKNQD